MLQNMNNPTSYKRILRKLSLVIIGCALLTACNQERNEAQVEETPITEVQVEETPTTEVPSEGIQINVGTQHTKINWDEQIGAINFYRFSNIDCDIENYTSCDDSKLTTINSIDDLPIEDDFINEYTTSPSYIKMKGSGYKSELIQAKADTPEFPERHGLQMVKFDDRMFVVGGQYGDTYYNDVWSSKDGITWELETEHAEFSARSQHQVIEFENKLWLFSGETPRQNGGTLVSHEVWSSEDGIDWTLAYEDLSVDYVVVFNERIWGFGRNKIYSSETGSEWVLEESNWSQMFESESTVNPSNRFRGQYAVFNNKIWMIAGQSRQDYASKNDVWSTVDGVNWEIETANAQFNARLGHAITVFKNKLWLSGGYDDNDNGYNDVWSSSNGVDWELEKEQITQKDHQNHQVIKFDNRMWLYGSFSDYYLWQSLDGKDWYITSSASSSQVNWVLEQ